MIRTIAMVVEYIWNEPSNRRCRWRRIVYGLLWQLYKRTVALPLIVTLDNGRRLIAHPSFKGASFAIYAEVYDSVHIGFVRRFASGQGAFVDVGANIGLYTLLLCDRFERAFAYEPDTRAFEMLRQNVCVNQLEEKCSVFQLALGDESRTVLLSDGTDGDLVSKVVADSGTPHRRVEMVTLDSQMLSSGPALIEYVKIDVEGLELSVLKGMAGLIAERRISLIQFERLAETPLEPLLDFFRSRDWLVFCLVDPVTVSLGDDCVRKAHDLFAVPECGRARLEGIVRVEQASARAERQ